MSKSKAVILLSGGLDSAVCLKLYEGCERLALGFDYGQPHKIELEYARRLALSEKVPFVELKLCQIQKVNDVLFAGRNAVLVSHAISFAQTKGYDKVVIGCNASDHERFPDCRQEFLEALNVVAKTYGVVLEWPLLQLTKSNVVVRAKELGVGETWTCYAPTASGERCDVCYSCKGLDSAKG